MNLFYVTSPFQYICANEARNSYQSLNTILVVEFDDTEKGLLQLKSIIDPSLWDHVFYLPAGNRTKTTPKLIKKIKGLCKELDLVEEGFFFAEFNSLRTKVIISNFTFQRHIYFDDGALTLFEYEETIKPNKEYYRPRLIPDLIMKAKGIKPAGRMHNPNNLEIFTIFNINSDKYPIVRNTLQLLNEDYKFNPHNENSPVGFLGQGSVGDKNHKPIDDYLSEIIYFLRENKEILYFPHRNEKEEVSNKIKRLNGVKYYEASKPIELEIIRQSIRLSKIVGMGSTALFTCRVLFPDLPVVNIVNTNKNDLVVRNKYEIIESQLNKAGVSMIHLC
ncbi:glycosyltransferase 52 family protein [Vibrio profundum]|uniref:glycosyltransferase 52 family protein n=1 Tax=Vibrio profundum TaxID=2910247 RepID=UPI003D106A58